MYVFPRSSARVRWAGLGDIAGPETWINGYVQLRVMAHELGHNFGVHHANSLQCSVSGMRVALSTDANCPFNSASDEYGDPFTSWAAPRPGSSRPSTRTSSAGSSRRAR